MPAVTTSTDRTASADDGAASARSPVTGWLAVTSLMLGIFCVVTIEILPIGLLRPIGDTFGVSDGTAGLMMTLPGFLAAVAAPTVTVAAGRMDRRVMLGVLMLVLASADFLGAAAASYWVMMLSRVLVGLVIGGFWPIAAGLAARLVPAEQVGRATAVIFSAVPLGSVLGVPAGVFIGNLAGWRTAFLSTGILTLTVSVALAVSLPPLPPRGVTRLSVLRGLLGAARIRVGLVVTFLIVTAHFATYTYVTPFLKDVTRAGPRLITVFLLAYGVAGIIGNFIAGAAVRRALRATLTTAGVMLAAATLLLPVIGTGKLGALVLLIIWGLAYGAVPVCSQTWFVASAPDAPETASVLFTSSFQATISLGALVGGAVVDSASTSAVMVLGGLAATLMVLTVRIFSSSDQFDSPKAPNEATR